RQDEARLGAVVDEVLVKGLAILGHGLDRGCLRCRTRLLWRAQAGSLTCGKNPKTALGVRWSCTICKALRLRLKKPLCAKLFRNNEIGSDGCLGSLLARLLRANRL